MKKFVLAFILLAAVSVSCFAQAKDIYHSANDICELYRGRKVSVNWDGHYNTREEAANWIDDFVLYTRLKLVFIEKPYKNEADSAYKLVEKYYNPEKGDLYCVITDMKTSSTSSARVVYIWIIDSEYYNYWIIESAGLKGSK